MYDRSTTWISLSAEAIPTSQIAGNSIAYGRKGPVRIIIRFTNDGDRCILYQRKLIDNIRASMTCSTIMSICETNSRSLNARVTIQ